MWEYPLECIYLIYKLRYRPTLMHKPMCFRLMAAMFDLPVTPTSESIHICPTVLLDLKNWSARRKFSDITLESRHPIYTRPDGRHLILCGCDLKHTRNIVLVIPYRLVKTACTNSNQFWRYMGRSFPPPC